MKQKVYLFDFDGTLTTRDTLLCFIRYACGTWRFLSGFLLFSPLLVLMKLGLYPNYQAKQRVFSWYFRGMSIERFDGLCRAFAADNAPLLRPKAVEWLRQLLQQGADIMIVSASIDNWVRPFFDPLLAGSHSVFRVEGTQVEVVDGLLTGRFLTHNCYGEEKVRRIRRVYPGRDRYFMTAYGDSRGDRDMLAYADESHYKPFL